ncbi:MAG: c-type cytochrome [Magnetospirillum sp.]|nr:c-type cytochrome [Magnetospirillum sp.]
MRASCAFLVALLVAGPAAAGDSAMLELADKSRCTACHDIHEQVTGPAWIEVAKRYRGDKDAVERLVAKVRDGGSGNWGTVPMSPNKRVPEDNIRKLVTWILALK